MSIEIDVDGFPKSLGADLLAKLVNDGTAFLVCSVRIVEKSVDIPGVKVKEWMTFMVDRFIDDEIRGVLADLRHVRVAAQALLPVRGLHKCSKALVEPQLRPVTARHHVSEPRMR